MVCYLLCGLNGSRLIWLAVAFVFGCDMGVGGGKVGKLVGCLVQYCVEEKEICRKL